jgi:two-component system response regulator NreC
MTRGPPPWPPGGDELVLSPHTVQSHRDRIMSKLDLHTKAALVRYAVDRGLVGD